MNIAFDAGAIEVAKGSGIGNYTLNQFTNLIKLYPEHNFYYFNVIGESELTNCIVGDNFFRINYFTGKDFMLRRFEGKYKELMGQLVRNFIRKYKIDVFYITAPFLTQAGLGYSVIYEKEWFDGIKVIVTLYDIIPYIMKKDYLTNKSDYFCYMKCIDMLKWTDCQLAISESAKSDAVNYLDFDKDKIKVIYGGVSANYCKLDITNNERSKLLNKYNIKSEFILCCVSADQRKNTQGAIRAYALLDYRLKKKYQMVIVGRLAAGAAEQYNKLIKKHNLENRVVMTDYVSDEELIKFYNLAKVMIMPSLYEGFGLPVIEAWACGTPVISSNNSSLGEVNGDVGLLFNPRDVNDISRIMEKALTMSDLSQLLDKGMEKLKFYQWDNVARLTYNAIINTIDRPKHINMKKKLACVYIDDIIYEKCLLEIPEMLKDNFQIEIFSSYLENIVDTKNECKSIKYFKSKYNEFDDVIYFITDQTAIDIDNIMKNYPGIVFILDDSLMCLFRKLNNEYNDIDMYQHVINKVSKYFVDSLSEKSNMEFLINAKKIITGSTKLKRKLLLENINKSVYSILPFENDYYNDIDKKALMNILKENLISSIKDNDLFTDRKKIIDSILIEEIIPKSYSSREIKDISHTIGFIMDTNNIIKKVSPDTILEFKNRNRIRVDMVTSWNVKCGIAEYTRYYVTSELNNIDFHIYSNITDNLIKNDENYVQKRVWEYKKPCNLLAEELRESNAEVIHIQYTEGFFDTKELVYIINNVGNSKKIIITCHNTEYLKPFNKIEESVLNKASYVVHQEKDINILIKNGIKKENIHRIPLGQIDSLPLKKEEIRSHIGINNNYPIIGSYGFLLPHKGIYETIQAISMLKIDYPNILYIASCSLYDAKSSLDYYNKCLDLIMKEKLQDNVKIITDFLMPEESLCILQACDIFSMVYGPTNESASGAVRFCIAAKRPIIVTKQPIFFEYSDCTLQIDTNAPINIANGIKEIISEERYSIYYEKVNKTAKESSWKAIGKMYSDLYKG